MSYKIVDNGGLPFIVEFSDNNNVKIHVRDKYPAETYQLGYIYKIQNYFIGKSVINRMTMYSGGYGEKWDGNSILLHIEGLKYVYIGSSIYEFEAESPIIEYFSPVGNNAVPYPHAVDEKGYYYLLIENVVLLHTPPTEKYRQNPYDYYYYLSSQKRCIPSENGELIGNLVVSPDTTKDFDEEYVRDWYRTAVDTKKSLFVPEIDDVINKLIPKPKIKIATEQEWVDYHKQLYDAYKEWHKTKNTLFPMKEIDCKVIQERL